MQLGNRRWETAQYNNRQQITQIGLGTTDSTQNLLKLELDYGNNTQNNSSLREQKITVPTVGQTQGFTATQSYTYDDLNRIQSATEEIDSTETWKQTFQYDRYGNRRFDTNSNNTTTLGSCSEDVCNPTISTATNRFTSTGYAYDSNGNVTQDAENRTFIYDAENHQIEVKDSLNNPIGEYLYDGESRRVKKISASETTIFVYNASGQLIAEYSTQTAQTPQVSYLTTDHLGSPRVITDQDGYVTSRKDYTAFGEENFTAERVNDLGYSGQSETRKGYTGYEKDDESGLDFAQARYYNAIHGRYTSVDPLTASASIRNPQTFNRYSYVLNSPYKFTDPLGLVPVTTGACGTWCPNVSGESIRGGGYRDVSKNFLQQQAETPDPPPSQTGNQVQTATATVERLPPDCQGICAGEVSEVKVTVTEINKPDSLQEYKLPSEPESNLRIGSDLRFNYQVDGMNITGTAQESIEVLEGPPVVEDRTPMQLRDGSNNDYVLTAPQSKPNSQQEYENVIREFNKDFITRQRITVTVKASDGLQFIVTQERTLTNRTPTNTIAGGRIRGYTFTMTKPTITIISPPNN